MLFQIFISFFKIGLFTIGGGYAMLPVIQEVVCQKKGWLRDEEFLDSISLTNSLPGPLATNAATFIGYRLMGIKGALAAILGTITPSIIIILLIAILFNTFIDNIYVQAFFKAVGPAVFALIISAVYKLAKSAKVHKSIVAFLVALLSFAAIAFFKVNSIFTVVAAALFALLRFRAGKGESPESEGESDD